MKVSQHVIHRSVAGEDILVPVGETALEHNGLFVLTPTGADMWDMMAEGKNEEEIVKAICEEYEVEESTVRTDLENLMTKLEQMNLLER